MFKLNLTNKLNFYEYSCRTVAACLGQMQMTQEQSEVVAAYFELIDQERRWLEMIPYRNPSNGTIPSDPLLYRLHEVRIQTQRIEIISSTITLTLLN